MNAPLHGLAERIRQELVELDLVVTRLSEAWQRARRTGDDFLSGQCGLEFARFLFGD